MAENVNGTRAGAVPPPSSRFRRSLGRDLGSSIIAKSFARRISKVEMFYPHSGSVNRRHFVAIAATVSLAGSTGLFDSAESSTLDLTVQNERAEPVSVQVVVADGEGTAYEDESDQIDSGVARAFQSRVGTEDRHEVTVSGEDWTGQLAWNATTCRLFDGQMRVTDELVAVAGECVVVAAAALSSRYQAITGHPTVFQSAPGVGW